MKTGIYGGTFDPPHLGHIAAARTTMCALGLDRLIFIPTFLPPHKELSDGSCSARQRIEMTTAAVRELPNAEVLDIEAVRGGRSYTVDTVKALREKYPEDEFFLIMGTDMFLVLDQWRDFRTILSEVTPTVLPRVSGGTPELHKAAAHLRECCGAETVIIPSEPIEISSSEIRALLPERGGRQYLSPEVYAYIIKNRCYGAKPDFEWLRGRAYAMLKTKRIPHVQGCEEEAARLAERWGENAERAREAGILHDITKKESLETQLILCEKYGIINDTAEKDSANLLHAKTGAAIARDEFGADEAVCSAIRWHTTGRANMSLLEKIIYMADYIEPTRSFEGLSELRRLAYENLDAAVLLGIKMGLDDLRQRGIEPHRVSVEACEYLAGKVTQ